MKRIFGLLAAVGLVLATLVFGAHATNSNHPIFGEYQNSVRADMVYTIDDWARRGTGNFAIAYSQPNRIWRLDGRRNIQALYFFGETNGAVLTEKRPELGVVSDQKVSGLGIGLSQDLVFFDISDFYFGAGMGGFFKDFKNDSVISNFVWGERFFIGYRYKYMHFEIIATHYSNGHLTERNNGMNSIGFSVGRSF